MRWLSLYSATSKVSEKESFDIPDLEIEADKVDKLIKEYRLLEAWELANDWQVIYKEFESWKPKTNNLKKIRKEKLPLLRNLKDCLTDKVTALTSDDYKEADRMKLVRYWGKDTAFLEFTEATLKRYGNSYNKTTDEQEKKYLTSLMSGLIRDLNLYFDVYEYNDLFNLDSHELRLKIAELHRLLLDTLGVEYVEKQKEKNIERDLINLL